MVKNITVCLVLISLILIPINTQAQEFQIAVGSDTTMTGGAVFGGANGIVAVQGDANSQYSINAQIIAYPGTLVGSRISLGAFGVPPGAIPVFDGTNYFLVWCGFDGVLKGQFINTGGSLVGSSITIAQNVTTERRGSFAVMYGENSFLIVFLKTDNYLYGQIVDKTGSLIGNQIQISGNYSRETSVAFDGTNFLVVWVKQVLDDSDKDIYGQFVSKFGALVGSNFIIDDGPYYSDNPVSLAYGGTRYLLAYHETTNSKTQFPKWDLKGKFISVSGMIQETITICDSLKLPFNPIVAFDGSNYFITWTQFSNSSLTGQFFTTSGNPIGEPSVILGPLNSKVPVGGQGFGGNYYLVTATRLNSDFSDGDVYGKFISPITGINTEKKQLPESYALYQNYPNPFNPETQIRFSLPNSQYVQLKIYNILGIEIATLVNEIKPQGSYSVKWNAEGLPSGIYFYTLQAGSFNQTKKLVLLR